MDIYIINQEFEYVGLIEQSESVIWINRYTKPGEFELYVPNTPEHRRLLVTKNYVTRRENSMVGVIERVNYKRDEDGRDMILCSGRCAKSLLARRVIVRQQVVSGTAWNRVYWLLDRHAINPTDMNRRIPRLMYADKSDSAVGDTGENQYTGDNLMQAIIELLEAEDMGWEVTADYENKCFVVRLLSGTDRTVDQENVYPVIFSDDFENLITSDHIYDLSDYANVASIAGEGEGKDRIWDGVAAKESGTFAGLERFEMFVDARDLQKTYTNDAGKEITLTDAAYRQQLRARGREKLAEVQKTVSTSGKVDYSSQTFSVGDLVNVREPSGFVSNCRVIAIEEIEDEDGYTVTPEFGGFNIMRME